MGPSLPTSTPSIIWNGQCGFSYQGTSIGLDEPMIYTLRNMSTALDPTGAVLSTWNRPTLQPCPPYTGQQGSLQQGTSGFYERLGYGGSFAYVTCSNAGGIMLIGLRNAGLAGSVPYEIIKLRTLTQVDISYQQLSGTIPGSWGEVINWANFPPSTGFNSLTSLVLAQNSLTGTLPPKLGAIVSGGSTVTLAVCDNLVRKKGSHAWLMRLHCWAPLARAGGCGRAPRSSAERALRPSSRMPLRLLVLPPLGAQLTGTIPPGYSAFTSVSLSHNPALFGATPAGVTLSATYCGFFRRGTSLGHDRSVVDILLGASKRPLSRAAENAQPPAIRS